MRWISHRGSPQRSRIPKSNVKCRLCCPSTLRQMFTKTVVCRVQNQHQAFYAGDKNKYIQPPLVAQTGLFHDKLSWLQQMNRLTVLFYIISAMYDCRSRSWVELSKATCAKPLHMHDSARGFPRLVPLPWWPFIPYLTAITIWVHDLNLSDTDLY